MSELAEFARRKHETRPRGSTRLLQPVDYPSKVERLHDVRAVICDVYGTLVDYWSEEFAIPENKETALLEAFGRIADQFNMTAALDAVNPADPPRKTLRDFYHGLITLQHEQAADRGISFPEIRIEKIWELIITLLKRHGYVPPGAENQKISEFSRKIAWMYNFHALERRLYPGVVETLATLGKNNIMAGLLSNAQFYTPVDLTLMVREQSGGIFDDIFELFNPDLTFFSYEYLVAKPDQLLFRRLYDALYEYHILPSQTVFIGNDLSIDILPAQEAGMKTALFTGDHRSTFLHDLGGAVIPDITFSCWTELIERFSFHTEERQ